MRLTVIATILLFAVISTSCHSTKRVTLEPISVSANKGAMEIYRESSPKIWDITHQRVALSFNYAEKTANGVAWIDLHPYFYATDSLQLDAKGMRIDSVMLITKSATIKHPFVYIDNQLKLEFKNSYSAQDSIQLCIHYKAMPYASQEGGSTAILEDRGLYFINTDNKIPHKPMQIWTQGETEANSHWMPTIDKPNERFSLQLELSVPDSFITLGNGYLRSQEKLQGNLRKDIWVIDKPIQAYAAMFAIGKYSIVHDEPWNGKDINYYVEPDYAPYAKKMFANTRNIMEYFSSITGIPYPWNKYSQVVVRDYVSGAMENTSASLFGEFMNQNAREIDDDDNENIVAHELFHQWFGDYVTAESWSNITLSESFANYGEQLWRRHRYGKSSADILGLKDLWKYVYGQSKTNDPALARYYYGDKEELFDLISYEKGGAVLNYLNQLIGDSAFFKAMNIYLSRNALTSAEVAQWRMAVEEATGQDWNWFFNQWYLKSGHPIVNVRSDYDASGNNLTVTIEQTQEGAVYRLPVKAWVVYNNEIEIQDWLVEEKKVSYSFPYKNGVKPVVLFDATHLVPGEVNYNFKPWQWLKLYNHSAGNIVNKIYAVNNARQDIDDTAAQQLIEMALRDKEADVRRTALDNLSKVKSTKWQNKWKTDVVYAAGNDGNRKVRAAAFDVLNVWKITSAKTEMYDALNDSSYMVAGAALLALSKADEDTAYSIAKRMINNDPAGALRLAIWEVIFKKGNKADITIIERDAAKVSGRDKIDFARSVSVYMETVKDEQALQKALNAFVTLVKQEGVSSHRGAIGSYLFSAASELKSKIAEARTNPEQQEAKTKYELVKKAIAEMIEAENNTDNLVQYKSYLRMLS